MIGSVVIWIAFASALASGFLHYLSVKNSSLRLTARSVFYIAVTGAVLASALLMLFIVQHRFEYNYVTSYSSRDLPFSLLITTFWAGQEGSFMLWALFISLIGLVLQRYSIRKNIEAEVMTTYSIVLGFLLLLISIKSPFEYIWQAQAGVEKWFIPPDGRGLNPLLQNFWMIIHPPILFLGFSSLAVPFVLAIAALWQKKYQDWILPALPWILFSALALGSGLILGGYWAYGVLGWGGWWGWDPVENSSLIPWIVTVALIHTILIQMFTGKLVRTNFILAVVAYLLVVYSTFLTRSGVLANASVHSFVDPGTFAYVLLVAWLIVAAAAGFGMIFLRRKDISLHVKPTGLYSRESILSFAALMMGASALVILFGTSMPLFSKSTLESSFYDKTNLPLAVLLTLLLGFSLVMKWNQEDKRVFFRGIIIPAVLACAVVLGLVAVGLRDIAAGALICSSLFAFILALQHGYRIAKERPKFIGGSLSHIGLAVLLLGIIGSGRYGVKQSVSLIKNEAQQVLGYSLTYTGDTLTEDGKTKYLIQIEKNGSAKYLAPVMFESAYNNSVMRTPDYASSFMNDVYIEPVSFEGGSSTSEMQNTIELIKGEPWEFGPMSVTFERFALGDHNKENMMQGQQASIGAVLLVKTSQGTEEITPVTIYKAKDKPEMKAAYIKSGHLGFQLLTMSIAGGTGKTKILVNMVGSMMSAHTAPQPDVLVADVSVKPLMNFVWMGAALIVLGFFLAMIRRSKENSLQPDYKRIFSK